MLRSDSSTVSLGLLLMQLAAPAALAAGSCGVSALDTVAGLGTEVQVTACEGNASLLLVVQSPDNQNYTQTITLDGAGNATTLIPSVSATTAGKYSVNVAGKTASFAVLADRADDSESSLIVSPQSIDADGKDTATVTAILRDRYSNPVTGRPLALIASRLTDEISSESKQTDATGRFLWTIRSTEQGTTSLTVYDIAGGRQMKLKTTLTVGKSSMLSTFRGSLTTLAQGGDSADLASETIDHFELSLPQDATEVKGNELFGLTIRAMHGSDISRGYIGSLVVKSSDPDAMLPKQGQDPKNPLFGSVEMRSVDQGERKVALAFMLRNGGLQTIEVSDMNDPTFSGKITLNVVSQGGSAEDSKITILDPKDRSYVHGGPILLQGHAPSLINLKVKGGSSEIMGESDAEGVFRINVPVNPLDKEITLFVTSENGSYESKPVHIIIDNTPPGIQTITLDPVEAKAGQPATITVKSEAGLNAVIATVLDKTVTLTEGSGGLYTGQLATPPVAGIYDITVTAKDGADNASQMLMKWKVGATVLPTVQGVTAQGQQGAVAVGWQSTVGVSVGEYKIYIADQSDPLNILYSIGTKRPVTKAIVRDLPLGKTYLFSLTVVAADGTESPVKSQPAAATPLGIALRVTPGKDSLLLEWTPMSSLPLDHYVLQYGTAPGDYSERRSVNGQSMSTVLKDLIGGVSYEVKLTPVAVTGKELTELASIAHGTPTSDGFVAGNSETVPTNMIGHPGAPLEPSIRNVPSNTDSGIPSIMTGMLLVLATIFGVYWHRARKEKARVDAFLQAIGERYLS